MGAERMWVCSGAQHAEGSCSATARHQQPAMPSGHATTAAARANTCSLHLPRNWRNTQPSPCATSTALLLSAAAAPVSADVESGSSGASVTVSDLARGLDDRAFHRALWQHG